MKVKGVSDMCLANKGKGWVWGLPLLGSLVGGIIFMVNGYGRCVEGMSLYSPWFMGDYLSTSLMSLTVFIMLASVLASDADFKFSVEWGKFVMVVMTVGVSCLMFFSCSGLFLFFFFFESSLIPTLVLILGWGYQPERLQAGVQMIMYTVCGSLPLLVLLCSIWSVGGTDNMCVLGGQGLGLMGDSIVFWFLLFLGMLVKVPVYLVHGWLPKAHVEAPVSGSMMLAGILLKLGIYGVCRMLWCIGAPPLFLSYSVMVVGLWGGVLCSFLCMCFYDIKSVIAYSSIGHMALSLVGVMSLSNLGWMGGICMALAHGICSPCLFGLANYTYMSSGSRSLLLCKGLLKSFPSISCFWFLFCVVNMGCPPSINFFSECLLFCSIMGFSFVFVLPLFLMCFLGAGYSLFLYASVNHGYQGACVRSFSGISVRFGVLMVVSVMILFSVFLGLDLVFL